MYWGQVSAKTLRPRARAHLICSSGSGPETCTMTIGTSVSSAWEIARCVASRSAMRLAAHIDNMISRMDLAPLPQDVDIEDALRFDI